MPSHNPAEAFVDDECPSFSRPLIASALRRAYAAADATIDQSPYLTTPGGRYQRGDLIMLSASFELQRLVRSGDLPFDGSWEFFARPTGKHFVMRTGRARITTSQVEDPSKKPRAAAFRANYEEFNSRLLFDDMNAEIERAIAQSRRDEERRLLHILHGYQDLNFAHIAYPDPERNRHIYRTPNLMALQHQAVSDLPPAEGPAEAPDPVAIEDIERHLRDNG